MECLHAATPSSLIIHYLSCHKQLLHLSNLPEIEASENDAPEAANKDGGGSDASKQGNHEHSIKTLGEVEVKLLLFQ